jgi:hypothetical protein
MQHPKMRKPATALHGEPAPKNEQLGGRLFSSNTPDALQLQAQQLAQAFALSPATARTYAAHVFGEVAR